MDAFEMLEEIYMDLLKAQNYRLSKEQEEYFAFIKQRLHDGSDAEDAVIEIECICKKSQGYI